MRFSDSFLVKTAELRKRKYTASLQGDLIGKTFSKLKPLMVEQEAKYFADIALIEAKCKRIVEEAGVTTFEVAQYLVVARQCYSLQQRFSGQTLTDEAQNVVNHWASRGLDGALLARVCNISGCGCSAGSNPGVLPMGLISSPPEGALQVTNIYVVYENGNPKTIVEWEE